MTKSTKSANPKSFAAETVLALMEYAAKRREQHEKALKAVGKKSCACDVCGGSGWLNSEVCEECGGSGSLIAPRANNGKVWDWS